MWKCIERLDFGTPATKYDTLYAVHPILTRAVSQMLEELQPDNKCAGCGDGA
ncbi:MAG: hypothetical protein ACLUR5_00235 [Eubacterium ventriosum]